MVYRLRIENEYDLICAVRYELDLSAVFVVYDAEFGIGSGSAVDLLYV